MKRSLVVLSAVAALGLGLGACHSKTEDTAATDTTAAMPDASSDMASSMSSDMASDMPAAAPSDAASPAA